ncbi:RHOMBOID-like protein 2 [Curcuma longa]|uniref:RHOMBOID-like protein 2 n=1 Tax=Curcuma longa TaxID=136217 RepID=UPI003D9F3666
MAKDKTSGMAPEAEARLRPWGGSDGSDGHHSVEVGPAAAPPPARAQIPGLPQRQRDKKWWPLLVPIIFVANVIMFVITMYVNNCPTNSPLSSCVLRRSLGRFSFQPLRQNPLLGPSTQTLQKMGALVNDKVVHGHQGWRLITCIWLHAGVVHLLANMLSLLLIGIRLEQEFGFVRIGPLYVISGIGGSVLSALFVQSNSVGASGALFGLLGAMLSELITNWTIYANKCSAMTALIVIVAINLALGILPHVDNFAHIGGFVTGFLLGFVLLIRPQYGYVSQKYTPVGYNGPVKNKHMIYQYVLWVIGAILLIVGFTVGLILLFRGFNGNDHCSWCHYLSCVPTSRWNCRSGTETCEVSQLGNMYNITCQGSGRNHVYNLSGSNATQSTTDLCYQLCS